MSQTYLKMFSTVTLFVFGLIKLATSDGVVATPAFATAAVRYQNYQLIPSNSIIENFARIMAEGLLNSPILGKFAHFEVNQTHDLFVIIGDRMLAKAGIYAPWLSEVIAQAAEDVGLVNSRLYFYATAYTMAKYLRIVGILTDGNVDSLAKRFVRAIEFVALSDGISDTETTMTSTVYGLYNVLVTYGLTTYNDMSNMFYLFAAELKRLAGK